MVWTYSKSALRLSHAGPTPWSCEGRWEPVPGSVDYPNGIPLGTFTLGAPEYNEPEEMFDGEQATRAFGPYFIPVNNVPGHEGIGIHGGGSASPHPLAAHQGWYPTENCIRLQN